MVCFYIYCEVQIYEHRGCRRVFFYYIYIYIYMFLFSFLLVVFFFYLFVFCCFCCCFFVFFSPRLPQGMSPQWVPSRPPCIRSCMCSCLRTLHNLLSMRSRASSVHVNSADMCMSMCFLVNITIQQCQVSFCIFSVGEINPVK